MKYNRVRIFFSQDFKNRCLGLSGMDGNELGLFVKRLHSKSEGNQLSFLRQFAIAREVKADFPDK